MYNNNLQTKPRKWVAKPLFTIHYQLLTIRAFTLVELLTVVVIISMLAGMSMLALSGTMTAAKESKTRGTIAKLDAAILDIFEGYQERFDNITIEDAKLAAAVGTTDWNSMTNEEKNKARALAKLHFISDIMRMEMPCQWEEIINSDGTTIRTPIPIGSATGYSVFQSPPVTKYYRDAYVNYPKDTEAPQSSELLFLIIANLNPEALENFHGSEIGDIGGNGLREFHDAWGKPILFLRWAPAFPGSDLQPDIVTKSNYPLSATTNPKKWVNPLTGTVWNDPNDSNYNSEPPLPNLNSIMIDASLNYSDPFDPYSNINGTWFVYPLIVSGGASRSVDLVFDFENPPNTIPKATIQLPTFATISLVTSPNRIITSNNILHPAMRPWGLPVDMDSNGVLNHYDNIHNHRSNNSF